MGTDTTGCGENKPWKPVLKHRLWQFSRYLIRLLCFVENYYSALLNKLLFCHILSFALEVNKRNDKRFSKCFPKGKIELDLSSLEKKRRRRHNNSSSSETLFVDRRSDQMFSVVIMREIIRN